MKPYLCVYAAWFLGNLAVTLAIYLFARRRVGVPLRFVWGGFAMSLVVVAVWVVSFTLVLIAADRSGIPATNGDLITSCALWSAAPIVLTLALHVAGIVRAARAPRRS